jgi:hypothetical protein
VLGKPTTRRSSRPALALAGAVATLGPVALARPLDPALGQLVIDPTCRSEGAGVCVADRALYTKLVSQLGFAIAPHPAHEARTTGLAAFDVSLRASLTHIDSTEEYWRRGTLASADSASGEADAPDYLQLYALELKKGFGFGIEAAASLAVMPHSRVLAWGGDLRVALLEGMRDGLWRYLPDTSVGLALRQATGLGELELGTLALDARVSRPLTSKAGFAVTPWLGYQWVRIAADSAEVDLTPGVAALETCQYAGRNQPGSAGAPGTEGATPASGAPSGTLDGSPLCRGSAADLANSVSFGEVDVYRHRVLLGASYRRELLLLGAQFVTDLVRPDAAQTDAAVERALRCDATGDDCQPAPRQWTIVVEVGARF